MMPRPCSATQAVARARRLLAEPSNATTGYLLSAGDYFPGSVPDLPWGPDATGHGWGADCRVAFLWCYEVPARRPGYNVGVWSTCSDCINYNSLAEDAEHAQDLVRVVDGEPLPGDIICYPTIHLEGHTFVGHGAIIVGVDRWDPHSRLYAGLDIVQVRGDDGRMPAAIATDGAVFDRHSAIWPKADDRSRILRAKG